MNHYKISRVQWYLCFPWLLFNYVEYYFQNLLILFKSCSNTIYLFQYLYINPNSETQISLNLFPKQNNSNPNILEIRYYEKSQDSLRDVTWGLLGIQKSFALDMETIFIFYQILTTNDWRVKIILKCKLLIKKISMYNNKFVTKPTVYLTVK